MQPRFALRGPRPAPAPAPGLRPPICDHDPHRCPLRSLARRLPQTSTRPAYLRCSATRATAAARDSWCCPTPRAATPSSRASACATAAAARWAPAAAAGVRTRLPRAGRKAGGVCLPACLVCVPLWRMWMGGGMVLSRPRSARGADAAFAHHCRTHPAAPASFAPYATAHSRDRPIPAITASAMEFQCPTAPFDSLATSPSPLA
jgi:hypothetical protein